MHYLVYVSSATKPFSTEELVALLKKARAKNSQLDITGMLLYKDGNFIQILEGEEAAVKQLYSLISNDPRHCDTIIIDEGEQPQRQFGEWAMGFRNLNDPELQSMPGFSQFMNRPMSIKAFQDDPTGCMELLNIFRANM